MKNFKSVPIVILLLVITVIVNGQTEKGKILLGGESGLNFSSLNSRWKSDDDSGDDGKTTNLEFSPQAGFFVIDNLALGIELPMIYSSEKNELDHKFTTTSFAVSPFVRYYFGKSSIKPYLHGGIGLGRQKMKYDLNTVYSDYNMSPTGSYKYGIFLYELGGGFAIFINEKISVDFGMAYASSSIKPKQDNSSNYRSITSGLGLGIGFVIIL